ncbi:MAG: lysylphosphatidylglycerol synthase transmembrane domain-containing protein [Candidatus Woesearchaeota archaeon]
MTKPKLQYFLTLLFTIIILFFIFKQINFNLLLNEIKNINIYWLIFSYLLLIFPISFTAIKWKILISDYKKITFYDSLKLHFVMESFSIITPLKMGDFINAFYKNDNKFNRKIGVGASIFEKLIDLITLSIFGLFGIIYFFDYKIIIIFITISLIIITGFIFVTLFMNTNKDGIFMKIIIKIIPFKKITKIINDIIIYYSKIRRKPIKIIKAFLLSFLTYFFFIIQGYFLFYAIGVNLELFFVLKVIILGLIIGMIPVTLAGIGTRDGIFILLLSGILSYEIIVLYALLFSLGYILIALIGLIWIKEIINNLNFKIKNY